MKHHPEYQQIVDGMKSGHLPADKADIEQVTSDRFVPGHPSPDNEHPEYKEYCQLARQLGYSGC